MRGDVVVRREAAQSLGQAPAAALSVVCHQHHLPARRGRVRGLKGYITGVAAAEVAAAARAHRVPSSWLWYQRAAVRIARSLRSLGDSPSIACAREGRDPPPCHAAALKEVLRVVCERGQTLM